MKKALITIITVLLAMFALSGCDGAQKDAEATDRQLEQYQKAQPIPFFEWSQYRETQIAITTAQAKGTATTTFFFGMDTKQPVKVCPSIGYPVPSTAQLTSPDRYSSRGGTLSQMEPTGVYTGNSTGTYVVCVINGKAVPTYWEGYVMTEGTQAHWDAETGMIVNDGDPTVTVKTKE